MGKCPIVLSGFSGTVCLQPPPRPRQTNDRIHGEREAAVQKNARRRKYLARICEEATTAVLGRLNAEDFLGYWSAVAGDEAACSRDRGYADGLVVAEKVVFSRMLTEAPGSARGSRMDR